jgi:hypothetical protein
LLGVLPFGERAALILLIQLPSNFLSTSLLKCQPIAIHMVKKVTPEVEQFISSNHTLSSDMLSGLIQKNFGIRITDRAIDPYLIKARSDAEAANGAKIEAVRAKILEEGDLRAEKYLKYSDELIEKLHALVVEANGIKIKDARDLVAVSQALQKSIGAILDFVKPPEKTNVSINVPDLSKLSDSELRQYRAIRAKLEGAGPGTSKTPPA